MRLIAAIILTLIATLPAYAVDSVQINRTSTDAPDGITMSMTIGSAARLDVPASAGATAGASEVVRGDDPRLANAYYLSDYGNPNLGATLQAAIDDISAEGGGVLICDTPDDNEIITATATIQPKSYVHVDLNTSTLKWTGAASGVMVENSTAVKGVQDFQLYNGNIDPGSNAVNVFKLHSLQHSYIGELDLVSANFNLVFMHLLPDAVGDAAAGEPNVVDNVFGPFDTAAVDPAPVLKTVLILDGSNPPWNVTTGNKFVGPWVFYAKEKGIVFKQYCDSNEFNGLFRITLANDTVPGTCVLFNDSATPSAAADVWGEHFTHLSCETWYPSLAGQKAVEINHAGGIVIDYLGNDRVTQGTWPVGMVTDNYSQGHKITYVEGAPNYKVKEYVKGNVSIQGTGNGLTFPDGSTQTTAPNDTAYDASAWNGDTNAPTKNAVRDKIESILATAGTGNVTGPVSSTSNALAQYSDTTGRNLKDGPTLATSIGTPGVDTKVPTEKAVRDALALVSPAQSVGTSDSPTFAGETLSGGDWVAGTGTVSAASISTLTANTAGSFAALKAGASIKFSSGTIVDVVSITDTSNVIINTNPGTVSSLTWSYRNPAIVVKNNSVDYGYMRGTGVGLKGDGSVSALYDLHNWGSASRFRGSRANGTPAAPTSLAANDVIMSFTGQGWVNGVWSNAGALQLKAGEAWTGTTTGSYWAFVALANGGTTASEKLRLYGDGGLQLGGTFGTSPGAGNLSVSGFIVEGYEEKTAAYTVSKDTSKITLASGTATVTLPKTLPAGTTSVLVTVAGAAASGVSIDAETGGTRSYGDAGAPTFANNKTRDVVCVSENAAATTTAAWRCTAGGNF